MYGRVMINKIMNSAYFIKIIVLIKPKEESFKRTILSTGLSCP